jgi:hypothetical protein
MMDESQRPWSTSASLWDARSTATGTSRSDAETNEFFTSTPGHSDITCKFPEGVRFDPQPNLWYLTTSFSRSTTSHLQ